MPRLVLIPDMFAQHRREEIEIPKGYSPMVRVPEDWPLEQTHVIHNGKRRSIDWLKEYIFSEDNSAEEEITLKVVQGLGFIAVSLIISVALHFIIKALTPSPKVNKKLFDSTEESPSYSFDGIQNTTRNGTPVSLLYGKHLGAGHILSAFTTAELAETEDRETRDSKNELYMLLGACAGPICAINNYTEDADSLTGSNISTDLRVNNNDGSQFDGLEVSYRMGNWQQSVVPGFDDATIQYSSGDGISSLPLSLTYGSAQTYVTNGEVQAFELLIIFPTGLYRLNSKNAFLQYQVEIQVRYRVYGESTWTDLGNQTFSNKTRSQYIDSYRVDDLPPAQYEIEVTRQTANDGTYEVSDTTLQAVNEVVYDDVSNKGIASVGVKALATEHLNGRQPTITYMVYGKECTVYHADEDFGEDTQQDFAVDFDKLYWGWNSKDDNSNRSKIASAKSHSILQNRLIAKHGEATSTFESSTGWTAPFWYKQVYCDDGLDVSIYADFVTSSTSDGDAFALAAVVPDAGSTEANYIWIGMRNNSGTEEIYVRDDFSGTPAETSYTPGAGERYFRITFDGTSTWTVYSGDDGSSWTQRVQATYGLDSTRNYAYVGPAVWSTSSSPDKLEVEFSDFVFADDTSYTVEVSSNPAWVAYDLLTDTHWGLGNYLDTTQIDLDTFQGFADFCNELVNNGRGGEHRRHRYDGVLDSTKGGWEQILKILGNYRATILKQGDKIRIAWQRAQDPVQLFSMANIKEGSFVTTYQTPKLDANYWEIQFLNAENDFEQDFTAFIDPNIGNEPYRRKTTSAYGITRVREAESHALFRCNTNRHITTATSFETGIDAVACEPYDVVSLQHDVPSWGESGRVDSSTPTKVYLDKAITLEQGYTYEISIRHNDDSLETQTVTTSAGLTDEIDVASWTSQPSANEVWVVGRQNILTKDFMVMKIERTNDLECKLECVEYNAAVYDDEVTDIPVINYSTLPDPRRLPGNVNHLRLEERAQIMKDGTAQSVVDVTFSRGKDAESYEVYYREEGYDEWLYAGLTRSLHFVWAMQFAEDATYEVAVVSVGPFGAKKRPHHANVPTAFITVEGDLGYPSDVSSISASRIGENVLIQWEPVADAHILGYELRYSDTSSDWDAATVLAKNLQSSQYHATDFVADTYYFLVKAISRSGIKSENATTVQAVIPSRPNASLDLNVDERSGSWGGTKSNMTTVTSGDLELDSGETSGSYTTTEKDATSSVQGNVTCHVVTHVEDRGMTWTTAGSWQWGDSNGTNTTWAIDPNLAQLSVTRQFRYSNSTPLSGDFSDFQEGIYTGRYWDFKVNVSVDSEAYKVILKEMVVQIDSGYT